MERILASATLGAIDSTVCVKGWVDRIRDHGGVLFIDLRDFSGKIQLVINPEAKEAHEVAEKLGHEFVISVTGKVIARDTAMVNPAMETGTVEVIVETLEILASSLPIPFPINTDGYDIDENTRLKYRYIDLRRERLQKMLKMKHKVILFLRNWLDAHGFIEIQTPLLTASSPEGARDFLVPSRLHKGKFYALPQAPQQYKQLLMVAGVDRYFQIAPCLRDEDPRADRHAGDFFQIDIENSFVTQEEFFVRMEPMFKDLAEALTDKKLLGFPFPRLTYKEALQSYGTDRPDLRFGMKIVDISDLAKKSTMQVFQSAPAVKAMIIKGFGTKSRKEIDELVAFAQSEGAKGLAWIKVGDGLALEGPIVKFFDDAQQKELLTLLEGSDAIATGDLIVFGADDELKALTILGKVRTKTGNDLGLADPKTLAFAWVTDFPMYEWKEDENKWDFMHNPFSMPQGGIEAINTKEPGDILAYQYDIVANGLEISSGSIRNHESETLVAAFEKIGYTHQDVLDKFGHMVEAFSYGAPPHGGFAPGLDRLLMLIIDEPNIRDVYAFPKNGRGQDVMMNAPREIDEKTWRELGIKVIV